jgi:hypothetical protein
MGIYNLNPQEIADELERTDFQQHLEGDFTEANFIEGVKLYIKELRKQGASIPKGLKPAKIKRGEK